MNRPCVLLALALAGPLAASAALPILYDSGASNPNPTAQGWVAEESNPGADRDFNGLIEYPGNTGPVAGLQGGAVAWQIHDQHMSSGLNVPGYTHPVSVAEQAELLATGWVFSTQVKIAQDGTGATWDSFVSWGLTNFQGADRRVGFAIGATGTAFFAREDTAGPTVTLAANTLKNYHTITAYGRPGTSLYDWYLDGVLAGTRDLLDNTIAQGSIVRFFSGSSPLINAASNWLSVSLEAWMPKDVTVALPDGGAKTFARWVPPGNGFTYTITPLASSGTLAFTSLPVVDAAGTLRFTPAAGTTGTAAFTVLTPHGTVPFHITANNLVNGFAPQYVLDYPATQFITHATESARIRVWRHPPGQRKGIVLILTGFNPNESDFGTPEEDKANIKLDSYARVAYTEGFDVWELHWEDGNTYIEDNAMIVQEILRALHSGGFNLDPGGTNFLELLGPGDKLVLAGGSMGGLVGRFALCYLDTHALPYRCDAFLSVDSPQEGAYIPIGLQRMAIYVRDLPESYTNNVNLSVLTAVLSAFDSPAARQMLVLHHTRANNGAATHALERQNFLNLLSGLGNWPGKPGLRMVAIANGRGDGQLQDGNTARDPFTLPGPSRLILDWTSNVYAIADGTHFIPAVTCFTGNLYFNISARLRMRAYAPNPSGVPGTSTVFIGDPTVTIEVVGSEYLFGVPTGVVHTGAATVDTSGTADEVKVRLREWIKANGTGNGVTCVALNIPIDNAIQPHIARLTEAESLEKTLTASSTTHWDYVPGAWRDTGRFASGALTDAGTVSHLNDYHTFIPTVSALALSSSVPPHSVAIPADAAQSSPFDALYHFGTHSNTGHLQDYDGWLSDIIVHELRIITGEFQAESEKLPHSIGWRGLYLLEENPDLAGGWIPRVFSRHGVYALPQPVPAKSFFRLSFPHTFH